jgi:hypothetical protein
VSTTICLRSARSIPTIAFVIGTSSRNRPDGRCGYDLHEKLHYRYSSNVLRLRWDTKPDKRIRGTFLHPATTRRTSFYAGDAAALQAQADLSTAYIDAAGRAPTGGLIGPALVGVTLTPGVFKASTSLDIGGPLTLNALGDPNAVFIFQIGSTLVTDWASSVGLSNGAQACNVFWQVGTSATLGTGSSFGGTLMALTSVTVNTDTTIQGRVLARNGAVTWMTTPSPLPTQEATGFVQGR